MVFLPDILYAISPAPWIVQTRSDNAGSVTANQQRILMYGAAMILPIGLHWIIFRNLSHLDSRLSFMHNSTSSALLGWLQYFNPYTRILEFFLGIATGIVLKFDDSSSSAKFAIAGMGLAVSLGLSTVWFLRPAFCAYLQSNFLFAPILSGLIVMSVKSGVTKRFFESRFMVKTGDISCSLYLLQFAIIPLAMTMIPGGDIASKVIKAVAIIVFSYCMAYGSYHLIERPTQSVIRGALSRFGVKNRMSNLGIEAITRRKNQLIESSNGKGRVASLNT